MYLNSGVDYYLVNLTGITIICQSGLAIHSPNFKIKLLSYPDLNKIEMMTRAGMKDSDINEEVCQKCIESILGFNDEVLDLAESPAGVVDQIATKVRLNSLLILEDIEQSFLKMYSSVSVLERMALVVANYSNQTYDFCKVLPVDELVKRYALCCLAFPHEVPPIESQQEIESKVG